MDRAYFGVTSTVLLDCRVPLVLALTRMYEGTEPVVCNWRPVPGRVRWLGRETLPQRGIEDDY
jgi:hypothetical protein